MADCDYACLIKCPSRSTQESVLYHYKLPLYGHHYLAPHQKNFITRPCCDRFPIQVMFKSLSDLVRVATNDFEACPLGKLALWEGDD